MEPFTQNKPHTRLLSAFLAFCILCSGCFSMMARVYAWDEVSQVTIKSESKQLGGYFGYRLDDGTYVDWKSAAFVATQGSENAIGYCLQESLTRPGTTGITYTSNKGSTAALTNAELESVKRIIDNGYPANKEYWKAHGVTSEDAQQQATQFAIWGKLGRLPENKAASAMINTFWYDDTYLKNTGTNKAVEMIKELSKLESLPKGTNLYEEATIRVDSQGSKVVGNTYETTFKITTTGTTKGYGGTFDFSVTNLPTGSTVYVGTSSSPTTKAAVIDGRYQTPSDYAVQYVRIVTPITPTGAVSGKRITLTAYLLDLKIGGANIFYYKPSNASVQQQVIVPLRNVETGDQDVSSATTPSQGNIFVQKQTEAGKAANGATFGVYASLQNARDKVGALTTIKTTTTAAVKSINLNPGTYYVRELSAPNGLLIDATIKTVTLDAGGTTSVAKNTASFIDDYQTASLIIHKENAQANRLSGATFSLTNNRTGAVRTGTTNAKGELTFTSLPFVYQNSAGTILFDTYTLQEIKAPTGYELDTTKRTITFTAKAAAETVTISQTTRITNHPLKGNLFVKKQTEAGLPANGATFGVYASLQNAKDKTNALTTIKTTTINATKSIDLNPGNYFVRELSAPNGLLIDATIKTVTITAGGTTSTASNTATFIDDYQTANLTIYKENHQANRLSGATFSLVNNRTGAVKTGTTNAKGELTFTNLPFVYQDSQGNILFDTYTLQETKAPEGYALDHTKQTITFTAKAAAESVSISQTKTVKNTPQTGKLTVLKTDDTTNTPLSGVTFALYKTGDTKQTIRYRATTGADGKAHFTGVNFVNYEANGNFASYEAYTLIELEAAAGFIKSDEEILITTGDIQSAAKGGIPEILIAKNMKNTLQPGEVTVKKEGPAGESLQGTIFTLTNNRTGEKLTATTNENGLAIFKNVPYASIKADKSIALDTYTLQETRATSGYVTNQTWKQTVTFTPDDNKQVILVDAGVLINEPTKTIIRKEDAAGNLLKGATLVLLKDGKEITRFVTTTSEKTILALVPGAYVLREEQAPIGYLRADDIAFSVTEKSEAHLVTMINRTPTGTVIVEKIANETGEILQGVIFGLRNTETGEEIEAITDKNGIATFQQVSYAKLDTDKQVIGTYTYELYEKQTKAGYVLSDTTEIITFDIAHTTPVQEKHLRFINEPTKTLIHKVGEVGAENIQLKGATLVVLKDGKEITRFETTNEPHTILALVPGEYVLREEQAPLGYLVANDVPFTVIETTDIQEVMMIDPTPTGTVIVKKQSAETREELANVLFALRNKETGEEVEATTDKNGTATFTNIHYLRFDERGNAIGTDSYELYEKRAKKGYIATGDSEEVTFDVAHTTPVQEKSFTFFNTPTKTIIEKRDTDGSFVIGASLTILADEEITDEVGNVVFQMGEEIASFTTTNEATTFLAMRPGKYLLVETKAPNGYLKAAAISFTVLEQEEAQIVSMVDLTPTGKVTIEKKSTTEAPLQGVRYLFTNETTGEQVVLTTDENGQATHEGFAIGSYKDGVLVEPMRFTIKEIQTLPGYIIDKRTYETQFAYKDDETPEITEEHYFTNDFTKVDISKKELATGNNEEIEGATLRITAAEDVFYTDVLTGEDILLYKTGDTIEEWVSKKEPHRINCLPHGFNYFLEELRAPFGFVIAEKVPFSVEETGEIQAREMFDEEVYGTVNIHKVDEDSKESLQGVEYLLRNEETKEEWTLITDENGRASVTNLPLAVIQEGKCTHLMAYTIKETKTVTGYALDPEVYDVEFEYINDTTREITQEFAFTNATQKAKIAVIKQGGKLVGTKPLESELGMVEKPLFELGALAGVEFTVYNDKELTDIATTVVSNGEGLAESCYLPVGTYYVKETKTPAGYIADETVYEVVLEATEEANAYVLDVTKEVVNHPCSVELFVYKEGNKLLHEKDDRYEIHQVALEGVYFGVYTDQNFYNDEGEVVKKKMFHFKCITK